MFFKIPETREKPWGTAHAIYCAKDAITEPFLVINADDFYGRDAFMVAKEFLEKGIEKEYATITYQVVNTMTENGSVKRGVTVAENGILKSITESKIEEIDGKIKATALNSGEEYELNRDALVSMNLLAFDLSIFDYLDKKIDEFFKENENKLDSCEMYIPEIMSQAHQEGFAVAKVLDTKAKWYGVTYKEDTDLVRKSLKELVEQGEYPNNLWG